MIRSFRDLHQSGNPFILANVWDRGTACLVAGMGAQALATSSGAHAFSLGRADMGNITRDESLAHAQDIISATSLPVSGDFENGFGHDPEAVEETVKLSAEIGLAGISIEDIALPELQPYEFEFAVERIRAASAKARALANDFVLVARADGYMHGAYDLEEAIRRIQAFESVGADCVYVPYLRDVKSVALVCSSVSVPVNVSVSEVYSVSMGDLAKAGTARISLGQAMATAAHATIHGICQDMFGGGDFSKLDTGDAYEQVESVMIKGRDAT